jgi:hypothetical protein
VPAAATEIFRWLYTSGFGGHKVFNFYESVPEIRRLTILPEGCCDCKKNLLRVLVRHIFD